MNTFKASASNPRCSSLHTVTYTVSDILIHSVWLFFQQDEVSNTCLMNVEAFSWPSALAADDVRKDHVFFRQLHYPYWLSHRQPRR